MVWVILGIAGSVLFAAERYKYWKVTTNSRTKLFLRSIGAGFALFLGLCLIFFIASTYWW